MLASVIFVLEFLEFLEFLEERVTTTLWRVGAHYTSTGIQQTASASRCKNCSC